MEVLCLCKISIIIDSLKLDPNHAFVVSWSYFGLPHCVLQDVSFYYMEFIAKFLRNTLEIQHA